MKNKYFEELKQEADWDDEEEWQVSEVSREEDEAAVPRTVRGVLILIGIFWLIETLVTVFLIGGFVMHWTAVKWKCLGGLALGSGTGAGLFLFIKKQIEDIVDLDEKSANARLKLGAILRIIIIIALLAFCLLTKFIDPVAVIVGILNMKFAAMLQPAAAGFYSKIKEKKHADR